VIKCEPKVSKKTGKSYFQASYLVGDEIVRGMCVPDLSNHIGKEVPVELSIRPTYGGKGGFDLKIENIISQ